MERIFCERKFFDLNKPIILNGSTDDVDYDYDNGEIIASTEEEVDEIIDNEHQGETRLWNNLAHLSQTVEAKSIFAY